MSKSPFNLNFSRQGELSRQHLIPLGFACCLPVWISFRSEVLRIVTLKGLFAEGQQPSVSFVTISDFSIENSIT